MTFRFLRWPRVRVPHRRCSRHCATPAEVLEDRCLLSSLSIGDQVFLDRNANGIFDSDVDSGISAVQVSLLRDDGEIAGVRDPTDTLVRHDTTDSSGRYLFDNLSAGAYLLEVTSLNFAEFGRLEGLISFPGAAPADNNVDNDDNGEPTTGYGVITTAIQLQDDQEPTGEDGDANTNLTVDFAFIGFDYGDAPHEVYPTLNADDGARHVTGSGLFLGTTVDIDIDGGKTVDATGDDSDEDGDDEDGVQWTSLLNPGETATVDVTASEAGHLNSWIDFNADGDWDDPGEQIFTDEPVEPGVNSLTFSVPVTAVPMTGPAALAQWLSFSDDTSTALQLTSIPDNDNEEKDIAVGDLDRDGWTDVVVVRKAPFSAPGPRTDLLLMNENGVLTDRTAMFAPEFISHPTDARDVLIADLDQDGWDDVIIATSFDDPVKYYRNLGADAFGNWLGFVDESAIRLPNFNVPEGNFCAVFAGDVNGDGAPDLFYSNYVSVGLSLDVLLINDGDGNFTDETEARLGNLRNSGFSTSSEIKDIDNDGDMDIIKLSVGTVVAPWNEKGVFILYNNGDGTFTNFQKIPGDAPYMFTTGDLNDDGILDFYMVDDFLDYVNIATEIVAVDSQIDFDKRFINSNDTLTFGGNLIMADLDNDGDLDLGLADVDTDLPPCESDRHFLLFRNQGDATGVLHDPWPAPSNPWNESAYDLAFLDINNDGRLDLLQGRCSDYAVFVNDGINLPAAETFARFRITTETGLLPTGSASDGEVEDYAVIISGPGISVVDVTVSEGTGATTQAEFTVSLTQASDSSVTVDYATSDGSAKSLETVQVASGLERPVFATAPDGDDGRLFILEQHTGRIKILNLVSDTVNSAPFLEITDLSTGTEQGLLGLAFDPDYDTNGYFYVNHTNADGDTKVVRYQVSADPDIADPQSAMRVLGISQPQSNHNGGWMAFGPDGFLYIATGDGGGGFDLGGGHTDGTGNAQDITENLLGKILRIDIDGDDFPMDVDRNYAIPASNPYSGIQGDDEIWAYGLRNPWRPAFDRATGDLFIADVGQNAREEINVQPASSTGGANYGWRIREGAIATGSGIGGPKPTEAIDPIYDYEHGLGIQQGFSVTGGYVYRGPIAELQGRYFFADFVSEQIWSFRYDGSDPVGFDGNNFDDFTDWTELLLPNAGSINNIASFAEDSRGNLYIIDLDGDIFRLESGGDYISSSGTVTFSPGETSQTVVVDLIADRLAESHESFFVTLSNSTVTIIDAQAIATISDDDMDLQATAFDAVADHVTTGQTDVTFTLQNTGGGATPAFATHIVWSPNDVAGDADDVVVSGATSVFASLAGDAAVTRTVNIQLDKALLFAHSTASDAAGQPVGTASNDVSHLFLVVDTNHEVDESSETNNFGQGHLVDGDDVTYFPWDTNRNGYVQPQEAVRIIRAIGTNDQSADYDGNGVVTPSEALSALQRIGYERDDSVIGDAPDSASQVAEQALALSATDSDDVQSIFSLELRVTSNGQIVDEKIEDLFAVPENEGERLILIDARNDSSHVDDAFASATNWLDIV